MRATKLLVGILQIFIAVFIVFQTYSAWSQAIIDETTQQIVYSAFIIAGGYVVGGILIAVYHSSKSFVPEVIYFACMFIGWFFARNNTTLYNFLNIWAWLAFVLGIAFPFWHLSLIVFGNSDNDSDKSNQRSRRAQLLEEAQSGNGRPVSNFQPNGMPVNHPNLPPRNQPMPPRGSNGRFQAPQEPFNRPQNDPDWRNNPNQPYNRQPFNPQNPTNYQVPNPPLSNQSVPPRRQAVSQNRPEAEQPLPSRRQRHARRRK